MKKMNNKGFSLVELIVVIAIMAVLIGVMAPTLLGNIEKSKLSKDKNNTDTLYSAWTNTVGDPEFNSQVSGGVDVTYSISNSVLEVKSFSVSPSTVTIDSDFQNQLEEYVGADEITYACKYLKSGTVTVNVLPTGKVAIVVTGNDTKGNFTINK